MSIMCYTSQITLILMATDITLSFMRGLRGYHVYQIVWTPRLNEILPTEHKRNNLYDRHAIAAKKNLPGRLTTSVVGYLPKELSRITRYIMQYGAVVTLKVVGTHHRRSPLVQVDLEIPVKVEVRIEFNEKNKMSVNKYKSLVEQLYKESVDGIFEDAAVSILQTMDIASDDDGDELEDELKEDVDE